MGKKTIFNMLLRTGVSWEDADDIDWVLPYFFQKFLQPSNPFADSDFVEMSV